MSRDKRDRTPDGDDCPLRAAAGQCGPPWAWDDRWEEWDPPQGPPVPVDVREAFELEDEMPQPEPEYGDLWGVPDEEELI